MMIHIPEPCHEDWDKMIPGDKGRFCKVCNKSVVDFRERSQQEITAYFEQHQGEKVCGTFRPSQLGSQGVVIRVEVSQLRRLSYRQVLWFSFFFAFSTLFSCSDGASTKQVQRVEIVSDSRTTGAPLPIPEDTTKEPVLTGDTITSPVIDLTPETKVLTHRLGFTTMTPPPGTPVPPELKIIPPDLFDENLTGEVAVPDTSEIVFGGIGGLPEFKGGHEALMRYLAANLKAPATAHVQEGKVVVRFRVKADGLVDSVIIVRSLSKDYDQEVIRVIRAMPPWIPAEQNGKPIDSYMSLPVLFKE